MQQVAISGSILRHKIVNLFAFFLFDILKIVCEVPCYVIYRGRNNTVFPRTEQGDLIPCFIKIESRSGCIYNRVKITAGHISYIEKAGWIVDGNNPFLQIRDKAFQINRGYFLHIGTQMQLMLRCSFRKTKMINYIILILI